MPFLDRLLHPHSHQNQIPPPIGRVPDWTASASESHPMGKNNEASEEECDAGARFCLQNPVDPPRFLPSYIIDRIRDSGCGAWTLQAPSDWQFGSVVASELEEKKGGRRVTTVRTTTQCPDTCLLSDLPILAGKYDTFRKEGIYYEVSIVELGQDAVVAIGTACTPYPPFRLPGWNRLSAGLHSDDLRIFWEDPNGGRDYATPLLPARGCLSPGDIVGCGYEFSSRTLFYTYNGVRLPFAFAGIYTPREAYDVYAAVGVCGRCELGVNFGGDLFTWKQGNEWAWRVDGHAGSLNGPSEGGSEAPPSYDDVVIRRT